MSSGRCQGAAGTLCQSAPGKRGHFLSGAAGKEGCERKTSRHRPAPAPMLRGLAAGAGKREGRAGGHRGRLRRSPGAPRLRGRGGEPRTRGCRSQVPQGGGCPLPPARTAAPGCFFIIFFGGGGEVGGAFLFLKGAFSPLQGRLR